MLIVAPIDEAEHVQQAGLDLNVIEAGSLWVEPVEFGGAGLGHEALQQVMQTAHNTVAQPKAVILRQAIEQGDVPPDQIDVGLDDRQLAAARGGHGSDDADPMLPIQLGNPSWKAMKPMLVVARPSPSIDGGRRINWFGLAVNGQRIRSNVTRGQTGSSSSGRPIALRGGVVAHHSLAVLHQLG